MVLIDSILLYFRPGGCAVKEIGVIDGEDKGPVWHIGNGPNEFIGPHFAGQNYKDSTLSIYDITLRRLYKYKWSKLGGQLTYNLMEEQYRNNSLTLAFTLWLDNGYIVSQSQNNNGDALLLQKSDFEPISSFCNPLNIETPLTWHLNGCFDLLGNKFVYATWFFGYIGYYEITELGEIIKHWEYMLSTPIYEITADKLKIDDSRNKKGFTDIKMTDKYVYCLYEGKIPDYSIPHSPTNLLIFDHQGHPVAHLKLDRECARFAVSQDNKTLYAAEWMEGNLVRYDLSNILEK